MPGPGAGERLMEREPLRSPMGGGVRGPFPSVGRGPRRTPAREVLSDYRGYDLQAAWRGRERTTRLESAMVGLAKSDLDHRRWLEIGCGYGRLTPALANGAEEYVALDLNPETLASVPVPTGPRVFRRVAANLNHLPFDQDSFTAVSLIRVLHHLEDPVTALREIVRVLAPGGALLLSYAPKPTLGSLQQDLRLRMDGHSPRRPFTTFSRADVDHLGEVPFPVLVPRQGHVARLVREVGLVPLHQYGHGPETLERVLPFRASWGISRVFGTTILASTRLLVCAKPGRTKILGAGTPLRWCCPRCGSALEPGPDERKGPTSCQDCHFTLRSTSNLVDARYIPGSSRRVGPAVTEPYGDLDLSP